MKKLLLFLAFMALNLVQGQLIVNNTTQTPAQLVQSVLLGGGLTATNIKFNGSAPNANVIRDQVGRFANGNTTNIGLTSGIIMSTGKASVAIGPNSAGGSSQPPAFPTAGDADLAMLTTGVVRNTAILEFDFVPTGQSLSFDFVFASEEYLEFVNSDYNDVFGFFISGPGITGPYSGGIAKNIALVPSTTTAISIDNVNNASNPLYYVNNGTGATPGVNTTIQYDGFTKVIAAISNVQCGLTYHIKLAIANIGDNGWDSAVFLKANSFVVTPPFSFPADLLVSNGFAPCFGTSKQICTGLSSTILHEWTLNGVPIAGVTGPCVTITQPGQLCVTVYPYGPACPFTDCMTVEFLPPMPISNALAVKACVGSTFNLSSNTPIILNGSSASDYEIAFYHSQLDAQNTSSPITNITTYPGVEGEVIWVGITDNVSGSGCIETKSFVLNFVSDVAPVITCGTSTNTSVQFNWAALTDATNYTVSYQVNSNTPINIGAIGNVTTYTVSSLLPGNNVHITLTPVGGVGTCFVPASFTCTSASCPSITLPSASQSVCVNGDPSSFSVTTSSTSSNGINFVYFTTPQVGDAMYTGGIPLGTANPNAGGIATYDASALGTTGSLPNTAGIYYVYAIANPIPVDVACRPYEMIQVTVNAPPIAPTVVTPVTYCKDAVASALTATGTGLLWYSGSTGGVGSATATIPNTSVVGTTTYYVSQTVSGCESPRATLEVIINPVPIVTVNSSTICQGQLATVTATVSSLGTYSYSWTVPSGVPNPGNVSSFTTSVAGTYSVIVNNVSSLCNLDFEAPCGLTPANLIFVDQSNFSCWKTTATDGLIEAWSSGFQGVSSFSGTQFVELNANEVSTLFQDISVLPGSTVNISFAHRGRLGTDIMAVEVGPIGGPYTSLGQFSAPATNWVYNSVPFTFPNNGVSNYSFRFVSVSSASGDLSSGNFLDNISITALNCPSVSTSGTVTVNATPLAPTVAPVTYCQNATATALTATGTSLLWYTAATGGVGSATAPTPVTTASGTTTYYVSQTLLGCEGPRASIVVTINATPLAPTVTTPVTYCQDATASALSATGTALLWYAAATGGVGSSTATIPSTTTAGNTTYYVTQTVSGCESPRESIVVTINATPLAPTVTTPVTYCQDATATALTATGTSLLWYTTAMGGVGSATAPTPITTVAGTTTYYVSQTLLGCEGPRASIAVTVNATPLAPTVAPVTYCQNATATALTATGTSLLWYTAATGGVGSATAPTPVTTASGTTTYYVSQTVLGCEGPRASIVVTINATPLAPTVTTPVTYCQDATASALSATGTALLWYAAATGGVGSSTATIPSTTTAGTTTYYVTQTVSGCESPRESIVVTINATPLAPTVTTPVTYCQDATPTALTATGTSLLWYTTATGGVGSATAPTPITTVAGTTTYYVSQTLLGCEGPRASIAVTVNATPLAPTVAPVTYCQNATATALAATGTSLLWYTAATGGVGSATAPIPVTTASGTTTYYVSQTVLGCEGPRASIVVTINATPLAPTVTTPVTYCQDATASALSATGTALLWYAAATGGVGSSTATIPSTTTAGNTTYYVTQTVSGCESPRESIVVTINATPLAPTVTTPVTYCQDATATALTATGTSLLWYTTAMGGVGSATAPTPITTVAGTTTYYVSQTLLGCEGPRASIAVTVNATPFAPTVAPVTYCQNATATALAATGTSLLWYTAATGGVGSATAPIPVTTASGTTTYYVSQTVLGCEGPRASIVVTILTAPVITAPTSYQVCDDNTDGVSCLFILNTKDTELTTATGLTITYHLTPTDATTGANALPYNTPYCNITNPQTIYPRVYNPAAPVCVSTTSFQLIVNPKPVPNPTIADYQLCDINNSPDGMEEFNLPTKSTEIINGQTSMVVTYYLTQADATTLTSPLPNLYTNVVANLQTIWFNIKNTVTGCSSVGSFNLVVNALPIVTVNSPTACQGQLATVSATAATSAVYSYVWSVPVTATDPGNVPTFTTGVAGVYSVVITNTVTGCVSVSASGTVTLITAPTYSVPTSYQVCDDNNDGVSCLFVLNTKDPEISTQAGIVITYHLTPTDAQTGANPLPSSTPYCNITNPQTIYVRVFNPLATTCASFTSFQLIVHPKPVANLPVAYHICDDNTDGIQTFDLTGVVTPQVLGTTLPGADYTITYFTSLLNAQAGTPFISPAAAFVTASTTVWIRVQNNLTGCYDIITVALVVDPLPTTLPFFPQYELCENLAPVCVETFDLTTRITSILQGQTGMQVTFYPSLAEAVSNTNPITTPSAYDNAVLCAQTLGIRITNTTTGCYVTSTMDLVVNPKPQPIPPTGPFTLCGTDQSGLFCFDLTTNLTPDILFQSPGVYTITYHLTASDATNNLNAVNASNYCTINPFAQFLWVRAENPTTHCFSIMQIELNVDPAPIMPTNLAAIANCDVDSNTQDGCTTFNLEVQTPIILAAQVVPAAYSVTYYTTQAAAASTPAGLSIFNTTSFNYCNSVNNTIWVRIENTATHCFTVGSFQLQVNTPIVLTTPTLYSLCDYVQTTSPSNDQYAIFNMLSFVGTVPGHTLEFFLDAAHTQLISNPSAFQNTNAGSQTVFVVATSTATGCKSYTTLTIQVLPIPTPRTDLSTMPLIKCDDVNPNDGYEIFDLTIHAAYIMNGDINVSLHYFPSYTDAVNNTSEILTPTAANVHQNVWIRVESLYNIDTQTPPQHCYVLVEQPIIVNPLPLIVSGHVYQECDDDTDGFTVFNLNSQASILLNGNALPLTNYTLAFYLDAALTQPIPSTFTNTNTTGNTQTIYVVATNTVTGCKSPVSQFTIMVNPKPTLAVPLDYATCDDETNDNDGYYLYPLDVLIPTILGTSQTLTDYDVNFYDTQYNPLASPPLLPTAITNLATYQAYTHTIWVVVKNKITGCERIASFNLTVEQKPQPLIVAASNVICVDFNPPHQVVRELVLTATNTTPYLVNTPSYTYQWYDATGAAILGATGITYTVNSPFADTISSNFSVVMTSTSPQRCSGTSAPFTVLQSGQAVTMPVGSQGYTITNAFSENQTITVNVDGYGTYQYSLDDGPRQVSNVFENVGLGEHFFTIWDTTGGMNASCDPLVINHVQTIDYPHYFTPNGDGIHDTWNISGLQNDYSAKIYIFDRYGKLIKQISPQGQGWDGTYNGNLMPSTDYWFTVDYSEAAAYKQFKAHITLKR